MTDQEFEISTDKARLDLAMIHDFLAHRSYWAGGIALSAVKESIEEALCFGVYHQGHQVGFARVVTDFTATAYIADVFVLEPLRGRGLGKRLVKTIMNHPELQGLRLWLLETKDAHELYRKFGFQNAGETPFPDGLMMIRNAALYRKKEP